MQINRFTDKLTIRRVWNDTHCIHGLVRSGRSETIFRLGGLMQKQTILEAILVILHFASVHLVNYGAES